MKAHYTLYFSPLLSSWVFVLFLNRGQGGRYLIHLNLNPDPIIYLLSSSNSLNFSKFQFTHMEVRRLLHKVPKRFNEIII